MKKCSIVLYAFFCIAVPLAAAGKRHFSLDAHVGVHGAVVHEYVFSQHAAISRLDWQTYAAPVAALDGAISLSKVFIAFSLHGAVPLQCGRMEDYDFYLHFTLFTARPSP
ncbi:MAG: omptin family outer membrane protease [Treponema sp.]|nr:omptin family outer membrane protease [Treponema sp.]